jgi:tRNA pseudouridine38-40 synthase
MQRWRVDLAYDGRGLHGFADQPGHPTVAGLLRSSLQTILRLDEPPFIVVAGRTDAGVHAFGQVCHVDLPDGLVVDGGELARRLNGLLDERVVIVGVTAVAADFHARFSATWRWYRYLVWTGSGATSTTSNVAWVVPQTLNLAAMQEGFTQVVGEHDFRSFCKRPPQTTADDPLHRLVMRATWVELDDLAALGPSGGRLFRADIAANAFCHNMVRSLVATAVAVGQGRLEPSVFRDRLENPLREGLPSPAPAGGLSLLRVGYGDDLPSGLFF